MVAEAETIKIVVVETVRGCMLLIGDIAERELQFSKDCDNAKYHEFDISFVFGVSELVHFNPINS